jgi:hypothetical protein
MQHLFGTGELVNWPDLVLLGGRFALDLAFAVVVIYGVYYRLYRGREFAFTYIIFNIMTFALCGLLRKVPMELGFALGLFAVFGMLRYRTEEIRTRDLTYLFIVIGIGILNGVSNRSISLAELLMVNSVITGVTLLELRAENRCHGATPMLYDNLNLLRPGQQQALFADIQARIGLQVLRVQVNRIDMLRDAAEVVVYHRSDERAALTTIPLRRPTNGSGRLRPVNGGNQPAIGA